MKQQSTIGKLLALLVIIGLASCGQKTNTESETNNSEAFDQAESEVKDQIESVVYDIPAPSEIPFLLQATGAEFNESLINNIGKIGEYEITNDAASMNLGVYATDIGYLVSYGKVQEALNYMSSTKSLADHLGVSAAINVTLLKRFEGNLANKDSLAFILNEAIGETDQFLKDDSRSRMAALLITGSFVEGLYIATELIKTYPKDLLPEDSRNLVLSPLMRVILEQEKALGDLLNLLGTIEQAQPVGGIKEQLIELQELYKSLNIAEQIANNQSSMVLTDSTLIDITSKVDEIRMSITK
jgi:hypothetical protein